MSIRAHHRPCRRSGGVRGTRRTRGGSACASREPVITGDGRTGGAATREGIASARRTSADFRRLPQNPRTVIRQKSSPHPSVSNHILTCSMSPARAREFCDKVGVCAEAPGRRAEARSRIRIRKALVAMFLPSGSRVGGDTSRSRPSATILNRSSARRGGVGPTGTVGRRITAAGPRRPFTICAPQRTSLTRDAYDREDSILPTISTAQRSTFAATDDGRSRPLV